MGLASNGCEPLHVAVTFRYVVPNRREVRGATHGEGGAMARWLIVVVLSCGAALASFGQTTLIISDGFETGTLDPALWAYGTGALPSVAPDDVGHGFVLNFLSSGDAQQIRAALYALPAFAADDIFTASVEVRRNANECWFGVWTAYDQPPTGYTYGMTPTLSAMWGLPYPDYFPGLPGDPRYPTPSGDPQGFRVAVPSEPTPTPPSGSNDNYLVPYALQPGQWYTLELRYTPDEFLFLVDEQEVFSLDASDLYYTFAQPDDWLFMLGDGGTHSWQPTNLSVDNVLLVLTKAVIVEIADAFPNEASLNNPAAVAVLDEYYSLFGPETLQAALTAAQGSWDAFLSYLFPPEPPAKEPAPEPHLVLVSLTQDGSLATLVVKNEGDGTCEGDGRIVAGLSYCTAWVPEWATWFFNQDLGSVTIAPGDTMTVTFDLPAVPEEAQAAFESSLKMLWTGYTDPDPADYIGIHFSVLPGSHVFGFLPML
jgi:hypothetical protein